MRAVDVIEWASVLCGRHIQNEQVKQRICKKFCIKLEHSSTKLFGYSGGCSSGQLVVGSFIMTAQLSMHLVSRRIFCQDITSPTQVTQPPQSPDLVHCDFCLFPKLIAPLKGRRFQAIIEIQENTTGQLTEIGKTVWGPMGLTWRGLRYHCSMYNVPCIFFSKHLYFSYDMAGYFLDRLRNSL